MRRRPASRASKKVRVAFTAPPGEAPAIFYPFALLKDAPSPAARAFLEHLGGAAAATVFRKNGFVVGR